MGYLGGHKTGLSYETLRRNRWEERPYSPPEQSGSIRNGQGGLQRTGGALTITKVPGYEDCRAIWLLPGLTKLIDFRSALWGFAGKENVYTLKTAARASPFVPFLL